MLSDILGLQETLPESEAGREKVWDELTDLLTAVVPDTDDVSVRVYVDFADMDRMGDVDIVAVPHADTLADEEIV